MKLGKTSSMKKAFRAVLIIAILLGLIMFIYFINKPKKINKQQYTNYGALNRKDFQSKKIGNVTYKLRKLNTDNNPNIKLYVYEVRLLENSIGENRALDMRYLSMGIQNDISLINGKDTLPCSIFHFENNGGITPYIRFEIGFDLTKTQDQQESTVLINDRLYNHCMINFIQKN